MEKIILVEIRPKIFQTKLLCAKAHKLRKERTRACEELTEPGQYVNFLHIRNNFVVILRSVLVRFYWIGLETTFEGHRSIVLIDKEL